MMDASRCADCFACTRIPRVALIPFAGTQTAERARDEVKQRGTPSSIPKGSRSTFAYEEDATGRLVKVDDGPIVHPDTLVGPGRYSPSTLTLSQSRSGPAVDFKRGSGRALPATSARPPMLHPSAPDCACRQCLRVWLKRLRGSSRPSSVPCESPLLLC